LGGRSAAAATGVVQMLDRYAGVSER
jgi:hypothetical protein